MNNKIAIKHIYITNDNFENKDIFLIHKNKYVEVTILIEFSGWLTVNGEVSYVSDGNVFVINRNVYHEISTKDKKGKAISLFIEGANEIFDSLENGYEIIDCNKHLRFVTDYIERLADKNLSDQIKHQVSDVVFNYLITELIFQKNKKITQKTNYALTN